VLPAQPEPLSIALERTAVVLVDMQNAFASPGYAPDQSNAGGIDSYIASQMPSCAAV
jgi:nicotinamidase-related amidase